MRRWVCVLCRRTKRHPHSLIDRQSCVQPSPRIRLMLAGGHHSHVVMVAPASGGNMFFCRRCGCHATTRPRALLAPCKGSNPLGRFNLNSIARRLHPYTGEAIGRPRRVSIGNLKRVAAPRVDYPVGPLPCHPPPAARTLATKRRRDQLLEDLPISIRARLSLSSNSQLSDRSGQPGQPGGPRVETDVACTSSSACAARPGGQAAGDANRIIPAHHDFDDSQGTLEPEWSPPTQHGQADSQEPFLGAFSSPPS